MRVSRAEANAAADVFLRTLDARLRSEVAHTPVAAPAQGLLDAGGKRLRARLLWWSACATAPTDPDPTSDGLVRAAAAIELAHLGSLIHDDIVDGGDTRRGVATLHRSHGVRLASDAGAALAHLANALVAPLGHPARRAVRRALLTTCRGQVRELAVPFVAVGAPVRLAIMQEKTGAFFELAAALGAIAGGAAPPARAAVCRFARRFGVAFQIADDVLDLAGDPRELGRANGADLRDGVLTLPTLLALELDPTVAVALAHVHARPDVGALAECAAAITRAGGVTAARMMAIRWLQQALQALAPLGDHPAIGELVALAEASVARGIRPAEPCFAEPALDARPPQVVAPPSFCVPATPPGDATMQLGGRVTHILDWFHPGLAGMVAARTREPAVRAHRQSLRAELRENRAWGNEAWKAADAIALAHALAGVEALATDPVHTLAMVDALHCAAIGLLNEAADPRDHEVMSLRARNVAGPAPAALATPTPFHSPRPSFQPVAAPLA